MTPLLATLPAGGSLRISATGVILFLAVGLGLFGLFRGLGYLNRVSRQPRRRKATIDTTLTVVETITGLAFVVSAVPMIFDGQPEYSPYFAIIVIVAVLWIAWVAIRDLVHGVFFKAGRTCRVGDEVQLGEVHGRVQRLGYRVLEVQTPKGTEVLVPYSQLTRGVLTRRAADLGATRHAFRLDPPDSPPLTAVTEAIELAAFTHHWSSVGHAVEITLTDEGALDIALYALDPLRGPEIEAAVREAVATLEQ